MSKHPLLLVHLFALETAVMTLAACSADAAALVKCDGRRTRRTRVVPAVTSPEASRRIRQQLGVQPRAPALAPARLPGEEWESQRAEAEREPWAHRGEDAGGTGALGAQRPAASRSVSPGAAQRP